MCVHSRLCGCVLGCVSACPPSPPPPSPPPSLTRAHPPPPLSLLLLSLQDLDIPPEVAAEAAAGPSGDSAMFVAPTPGVPPPHKWQSKCQLAAEQAAAGAFDTAMRLLTRCV